MAVDLRPPESQGQTLASASWETQRRNFGYWQPALRDVRQGRNRVLIAGDLLARHQGCQRQLTRHHPDRCPSPAPSPGHTARNVCEQRRRASFPAMRPNVIWARSTTLALTCECPARRGCFFLVGTAEAFATFAKPKFGCGAGSVSRGQPGSSDCGGGGEHTVAPPGSATASVGGLPARPVAAAVIQAAGCDTESPTVPA